MTAGTNQLVRAALRRGIRLTGVAMRWQLERRIESYRRDQAALRARYGIREETPIHTYDATVRAAVEAYAAAHPGTRLATTSGSTGEPKKIAYPPQRLRAIKQNNLSIVSRIMAHHRIRGAALFILSGLEEDDSLSTMLLSDRGREPPRLSALLMPARYLRTPAFRAVADDYGMTAARLLLLATSDPGLLYATNPSTLALFLTDLHENWAPVRELAGAVARDPGRLDPAVLRALARVAAPGWRDRLAAIAAAPTPLPMRAIAPGLSLYICWDGGYTRPFVDAIQRYLPPDEFTLIPMYSMSTETIETLTYFDGDRPRFLAIAPGVLYELLPDGEPDDPARLIAPWAAEAGARYSLVVSDPYGLVRYQTEDIFRCDGRVGDVPDLRFERRRGLTYSFTGEKLTDRQLELAFDRLRADHPELARAGAQLALIPDRPAGATVPRYCLAIAPPGAAPAELADRADQIAARFDQLLGAINQELAGKQRSGRLGPTAARLIPYDDLAARLDAKTRTDDDRRSRTWDTQFKLLPLYRKLWDDYGLPRD